jgi:hypothetical protein
MFAPPSQQLTFFTSGVWTFNGQFVFNFLLTHTSRTGITETGDPVSSMLRFVHVPEKGMRRPGIQNLRSPPVLTWLGLLYCVLYMVRTSESRSLTHSANVS